MSSHYVILDQSKTGPTLGLGSTKEEAWKDFSVLSGWKSKISTYVKAFPISAEAFKAIEDGDPLGYANADILFPEQKFMTII